MCGGEGVTLPGSSRVCLDPVREWRVLGLWRAWGPRQCDGHPSLEMDSAGTSCRRGCQKGHALDFGAPSGAAATAVFG